MEIFFIKELSAAAFWSWVERWQVEFEATGFMTQFVAARR